MAEVTSAPRHSRGTESAPYHSMAPRESGPSRLPLRRPGAAWVAVAQVRGVLAERVVLSTPLDPFLSLRALATYSGLSVRKLREHLGDTVHPLPHYRVGGKVLVRRSEFDVWVTAYRSRGPADVAAIVDDVLRDLATPARPRTLIAGTPRAPRFRPRAQRTSSSLSSQSECSGAPAQRVSAADGTAQDSSATTPDEEATH